MRHHGLVKQEMNVKREEKNAEKEEKNAKKEEKNAKKEEKNVKKKEKPKKLNLHKILVKIKHKKYFKTFYADGGRWLMASL
jgi:hypothetical protein